LKKDHSEPYLFGADEGLGLEGATFKWNEVLEVAEKGKELGQNKLSSSPTSSEVTDEASTTTVDNISERSIGERVFELRDMTIRFPEGELTVITGPTASGKTALLVSSLSFLLFLQHQTSYFRWPCWVK
jgi:excinuclease UvrABC ATPase subunit